MNSSTLECNAWRDGGEVHGDYVVHVKCDEEAFDKQEFDVVTFVYEPATFTIVPVRLPDGQQPFTSDNNDPLNWSPKCTKIDDVKNPGYQAGKRYDLVVLK